MICPHLKLPTRIGSSSVLRTTDHYRRYTLGGISSATRLTGWRNPPLTNQTSVVTADLTAGVESHRAATTSVGKSAAPGLEPRTSKSGVCSSHRYAIQSWLCKGVIFHNQNQIVSNTQPHKCISIFNSFDSFKITRKRRVV